MSPHEVCSRDTLVKFVRQLHVKLLGDPDAFENPTLERYLESLAAWLEDSDGAYRNMGRTPPNEPSWRDVAVMLHAATIYE